MFIPSLQQQWLELFSTIWLGGALATSGNPQTQPDTQSLCGTPHRAINLHLLIVKVLSASIKFYRVYPMLYTFRCFVHPLRDTVSQSNGGIAPPLLDARRGEVAL